MKTMWMVKVGNRLDVDNKVETILNEEEKVVFDKLYNIFYMNAYHISNLEGFKLEKLSLPNTTTKFVEEFEHRMIEIDIEEAKKHSNF